MRSLYYYLRVYIWTWDVCLKVCAYIVILLQSIKEENFQWIHQFLALCLVGSTGVPLRTRLVHATHHRAHRALHARWTVMIHVNTNHHQSFLFIHTHTYTSVYTFWPTISYVTTLCSYRKLQNSSRDWQLPLTDGTLTAHNSPPILQFICSRTFWLTLRSLFPGLIVLWLIICATQRSIQYLPWVSVHC